MFSGSVVALATPFSRHGIDERAFAELVTWQVEQGSAALAVGTVTGEAPTLAGHERDRLVALAAEVAAGRVPVIAGISVSCTSEAVRQACAARLAGADALLVSVPPYSRPGQEGIYRHVEAIAVACSLPILVRNDPGRTRVEVTADTASRLARLGGVVGFVEAADAPSRPVRHAGARPLCLLTATDAAAAPFALAGGSGTLSVVANVTPRLCADLHAACRAGAPDRANAIQGRLAPLIGALALEACPSAVKYALFLMRGHFNPLPRLPLVLLSCEASRHVAAALEGLRDEIHYA